tara:strand:- start:537 stop:875 length:339 start_codon:yes stop_codon:yes gene_type:complete
MERYKRSLETVKHNVKPKLKAFIDSWDEFRETLELHYQAKHPLRRRTCELKRQMDKIRDAYNEDVREIFAVEEEEEGEDEDSDEDDEEEDNGPPATTGYDRVIQTLLKQRHR